MIQIGDLIRFVAVAVIACASAGMIVGGILNEIIRRRDAKGKGRKA